MRDISAALLALLTAAYGACPTPPGQFQEHLEAADAKLRGGDVMGFVESLEVIQWDLECLLDPISADEAAALHFMTGMSRGIEGDLDAAVRSFAATRELVTAFTPPFLPAPGHPLRDAWDRAAPGLVVAESHTLPLDPGVSWVVDGRFGTWSVPSHRAAVVQRLDHDAGWLVTWYVDREVPQELRGEIEVRGEPVAENVEPPPDEAATATPAEPVPIATAEAVPEDSEGRIWKIMGYGGGAAHLGGGIVSLATWQVYCGGLTPCEYADRIPEGAASGWLWANRIGVGVAWAGVGLEVAMGVGLVVRARLR